VEGGEVCDGAEEGGGGWGDGFIGRDWWERRGRGGASEEGMRSLRFLCSWLAVLLTCASVSNFAACIYLLNQHR
jgi:hypothetical protein